MSNIEVKSREIILVVASFASAHALGDKVPALDAAYPPQSTWLLRHDLEHRVALQDRVVASAATRL